MDERENPYAAPQGLAGESPSRSASRIPWWLLEIAAVFGIVVALLLLFNMPWWW